MIALIRAILLPRHARELQAGFRVDARDDHLARFAVAVHVASIVYVAYDGEA